MEQKRRIRIINKKTIKISISKVEKGTKRLKKKTQIIVKASKGIEQKKKEGLSDRKEIKRLLKWLSRGRKRRRIRIK